MKLVVIQALDNECHIYIAKFIYIVFSIKLNNKIYELYICDAKLLMNRVFNLATLVGGLASGFLLIFLFPHVSRFYRVVTCQL